MMQWVEESDRNDPLIPLKKEYKAFNYYHLPDGKVACLWKHALTSISNDEGKTWDTLVYRAKGFVNSNAKIWGQRLTDGSYATVYNPSEFRWPLAISTSADGLNYTTLNLVHGEITPMRYGGNYKSYGPQYTRGIQEGNGTPPDRNLWVSYSMNKEDMWVSRIPVPVKITPTSQANDSFEKCTNISELTNWNIYSPLWAPVSLENVNGENWLTLSDKDPFDFAKVVRKIPATSELKVSFNLLAHQNNKGIFRIEFLDEKGIPTPVERAFVCPPGSRVGPATDAERSATIRSSLLAGYYEKAVDRESAYEVLNIRAQQSAAEAKAEQGFDWGGILGGGGTKKPAASRSDSVLEAAAKSVARTIGSELGRQIVRGVLGGILGGRK